MYHVLSKTLNRFISNLSKALYYEYPVFDENGTVIGHQWHSRSSTRMDFSLLETFPPSQVDTSPLAPKDLAHCNG